MTSTGIPPHVTTLKELAKLHSNYEPILLAIESIPEKTANIITEELENRALERIQ